jgi:PAS domain S-box-containing protein
MTSSKLAMNQSGPTHQDAATHFNTDFIAGRGEMAERTRSFSWATTSVGPIDTWPQSLRTILGILLSSKFPMFLFWGPELLCFYNDAYRPSLGNDGKHPHALARPGEEVWPEIWHIIYPLITQVQAGGEATFSEDQLIPIYRNGKLEDVYWTFSFSAVYNESGTVGGVMVVCSETTDKVVQLTQQKNYLQSAIAIADLASYTIHVDCNPTPASDKVKDCIELDSFSQAMEILSGKVHPDDKQLLLQTINRSLESEEKSRHDISYRLLSTIDGTTRYLRSIGKTIFKDGTPHIVIGIIQDITLQVSTLQKLGESESRFRNMLEQTPVAIGLTRNKDHVFENINLSMLRIINKEHKDKVIGKRITEVLPELIGQPVMKNYAEVLENGKAFKGDEIPIHVNVAGKLELGYYNLSYTPLVENGTATGTIHIAVDVTEMVTARKQLEESEQRFRIMADASPTFIWALNPDTSVKYANTFMLEFLGLSLEDFLNVNWIPFVHPKDQALSLKSVEAAIRDRRFYKIEHRMLCQDGQYRWIVSQGAPSYYANGDLWGYVGSAIDITETKQAEEKLQHYYQELAALNEELAATNDELKFANEDISESRNVLEKTNSFLSRVNADLDNFVYTASHDLKAPINNIEGLMHVLTRKMAKQGWQDASLDEVVGMIDSSIVRFKRTVAALTDISKVKKQMDEAAEAIDLSAIIADVLLDLHIFMNEAGAIVEQQLTGCPQILFSEKNLKSIFYNLISNALKYKQASIPPLVLISFHHEENYLVISVKDNGLGLDTRDESKVFGMFQRLHSHVEGTGVGLYIVKRMVENGGGKITVQSKVGYGSTFRVYFKTA